MKYAHAVCLLAESDAEITATKLTAVMEAAGFSVDESRVRAIVAALEDVDLDALKDGTVRAPAAVMAAQEATNRANGDDSDAIPDSPEA